MPPAVTYSHRSLLQPAPTPVTYNHLNIDTEGVIHSQDSDPFHVFIREDHPIVGALIGIPRAITRVHNPFPHPPHSPTNPHHRSHASHHQWFRVHRGVFYSTTGYMAGAYDIDEHLATHYEYPPFAITAQPTHADHSQEEQAPHRSSSRSHSHSPARRSSRRKRSSRRNSV